MGNFFLERLKRIQKLQQISQHLHDTAIAQYQKETKDFGYWCFKNLTVRKDFKWYFSLADFEKIDPIIVPKIWDDRKRMSKYSV